MARFLRVALAFAVLLAVLPLDARQAPSGADRVRERYTKYEFRIPMRDGARLFTSVYVPKDGSTRYPFLITRTPYSVGPYGIDAYRSSLGPSEDFQASGFIFVYQDARGRYMSEGEFKQVRPHVPVKRGPQDVDESSDMHDTIAWLLDHVPNHNGRAGLVGVSQPGFHVAASIIDAHPALRAASPQAPTADYYLGDDVYHNGAFMLGANFGFYSSFQPRVGGPQLPAPEPRFDPGTPDAYEFFLSLPPLAEVNQTLFGGRAGYWQEIVDHPNYDEFWQVRSVWKHAKNITPAILNVGGWFDAEDPMGPLHMFRSIDRLSPATDNRLVMGPWSHGGWSRGPGDRLGNATFAVKTGEVFRGDIQFAFFMHHLKDAPLPAAFAKATMFATGINEFRRHGAWPPASVRPLTLSLQAGGRIAAGAPASPGARTFDEYVSDPNRPVPYVGYVASGMTSDYMTEDQRFAATRPDVLVYSTGPLEEDLAVAGPISICPHRIVHRHGQRLRREAHRRVPRELPAARAAGPRAGAAGHAAALQLRADGRLPAARPRRTVPGQVPEGLRGAGAAGAGRTHDDHLRSAGRLPRVPPGPPADRPGAEFLVPPGRPQPPAVHGDPESEGLGFPEGDAAGVPRLDADAARRVRRAQDQRQREQ